jgi:hypothetical protein
MACGCCGVGCCCVGYSEAGYGTKSECEAAGGVWKPYACGRPTPATIPLTLTINDYGNFDFRCLRGVIPLYPGAYPTTGVGNSYVFSSPRAFLVGIRSPHVCSCFSPVIYNALIFINPEVIVKNGGAVNCNPQSGGISLSNFNALHLIPAQWSGRIEEGAASQFATSWPGLCTGESVLTGEIRTDIGNEGGIPWPEDVIGTFILGNPLP